MNRDAAQLTGRTAALSWHGLRALVVAAALSLLPLTGQASFVKLGPVPKDFPDPPRQSLETKRGGLETRLNDIKGRGKAFNSQCKGVEEGSPKERECQSQLKKLLGLKAAYNRDAKNFNASLGAASKKAEAGRKKAVMAFFTSVATAVEKEKNSSIITAPLTPGSANPGLLGDPESAAKAYAGRKKDFEARKKDALRRFKEAHDWREPCRAGKVSCSKDGKAYDPEEGIRRRTHQYFVWGELSYYIRFEDFRQVYGKSISNKEKAYRMLGLAAVKAWPWGAEMGYIIAKDISEFGSTPPGGEGSAQKGLKKAFKDNQGFKP